MAVAVEVDVADISDVAASKQAPRRNKALEKRTQIGLLIQIQIQIHVSVPSICPLTPPHCAAQGR